MMCIRQVYPAPQRFWRDRAVRPALRVSAGHDGQSEQVGTVGRDAEQNGRDVAPSGPRLL